MGSNFTTDEEGNVTLVGGHFTAVDTPQCKVYRTEAQTVSNGLWTRPQYTSELYDTDDMHDIVTDNQRITINTPGKIGFRAVQNFYANSSGYRKMRIRKNESTNIDHDSRRNMGASHGTYLRIDTSDRAIIGDYYEVQMYQDTGSDLNLGYGVENAFFEAYKLP